MQVSHRYRPRRPRSFPFRKRTDQTFRRALELGEAIHIIRRARPKKAVLTHLYPLWDEVDFDAEVKNLDRIHDIIQAFDGLELEI